MTFTLYLPYYSYDSNFEVDQNYYKSNEDYAKAMNEEYNRSKDYVFNAMSEGLNRRSNNSSTASFHAIREEKNDHVAYSSCEAKLIAEDNTEENVDTMIGHMAYQDVFIVEMELNFDTIQEDFESDLYAWKKSHDAINKYAKQASEDWLLANEPKRNIKMSFKNKADETVYMELENCKILEQTAINKFVILIERASIIDKFI